MPTVAICCGCWQAQQLTKHHVFPKRHFPDLDIVVLICRECHNGLELEIYNEEQEHGGKLPKHRYPQILMSFIQGRIHKSAVGFKITRRKT